MKAQTKDKWYDERVKLALKAFNGGYVIFSPDSQKWYTPRSYVESGKEVTYRNPYGQSDKLSTIVMHKPGNAILAQSERVQRENIKLLNLIQEINDSFSFEVNNKKH